ncbi:MAG: hypothetical protein ABEI98_11200, partial [Halorhabdus sp.]
PDEVNEAIDRIEDLDQDERLRLFEAVFEELVAVYDQSDDGYVRQSVVRAVDAMTPGLAIAFNVTHEESDINATRADAEETLDTATGFLLDAIQDDDGRVRQSAKRALKSIYRGYEALDDSETVAALAAELEDLADSYEGSRRDHLLESKQDAEFFRQPTGTRLVETIQELSKRSDDLD